MNKTYFKERLNKLLSFDLIRISKLLELIQYTVLYTILTLPLSILVENIFPAEDRDKSNWIIIFEIIFQMVILAIVVFYIQKIVKLIPFLFPLVKNYEAHKIFEYHGEITIGFIFIGSQINIVDKIEILSERMTEKLNNIFK